MTIYALDFEVTFKSFEAEVSTMADSVLVELDGEPAVFVLVTQPPKFSVESRRPQERTHSRRREVG